MESRRKQDERCAFFVTNDMNSLNMVLSKRERTTVDTKCKKNFGWKGAPMPLKVKYHRFEPYQQRKTSLISWT